MNVPVPKVVRESTEPVVRQWAPDDAILYALGVGAGRDPHEELAFTTENSTGQPQQVLPTFGVVLAPDGVGLDLMENLDRTKSVHGSQSLVVHRGLPPAGQLVSTTRVVGIYDKGSGTLMEVETVARSVEDETPLFTTRSGIFFRQSGGWGGERGPSVAKGLTPERPPDMEVGFRTRQDQALLYRLCGDRNPLHSDPVHAVGAGFDRPILHGLCTFGIVGRLLLRELCGSDPSRFSSLSGYFSRPVWPGESLTVRAWTDEPGVYEFQVAGEDGRFVFEGGRFGLT